VLRMSSNKCVNGATKRHHSNTNETNVNYLKLLERIHGCSSFLMSRSSNQCFQVYISKAINLEHTKAECRDVELDL
jgi:hypothetical protein